MLLYLIFGLVDVSTIAGSLACLGLFTGITVAQPGLFAWTALALAIFAAFNILLARAVFAWIDRWLAQRRTREIVGAIFLLAMLSLQMLNPAFHERRRTGPVSHEDHAASPRELEERYMPWLHRANAIQRWLPPGLAVQAVRRAGEVTRSGEGNGAPISGSIAAGALGSLESLGVLAVWMLATGGVLAARLKSEYAGENLGQAPARQKAQSRESGRQLGGSGPIAAVIEKDLRALLRTLPLLYAVGAPLLLMAIFSGAFLHGIGPRGNVFALALPLCLVYAQLGFTQVFYNNLGTEGAGIQIYFLSPTPMRSVMLAKNLFHGALFWLVALTAGVLASLRLGVPQPAVIAATAAWLMFSLPCNLAAGNIFSLTMPYRVNPGRMARQRGSQANALLSLLVQLGILSVGAAVFALTYFLDRLWLAAPIFLVMAAMAMAVWRRLLANVDGMAAQRREMLMEKLTKIS
jgi:ABC-2 type transport system permease protein